MEPEHRKSRNQWSPLNWYHATMWVFMKTKFKIEIPDADLKELEEMVILHLDRWVENKLKGEKQSGRKSEINRAPGAGGKGARGGIRFSVTPEINEADKNPGD
jgi:hypothetical protein